MGETKRFNAFKYHRLFLTQLGIYPTQSQSSSIVFFKSWGSYYVLLTLSTVFISASVFMYENLSEFTVAVRQSILIIATVQCVGMFFYFGINVNEIHAVHSKLQEIIDKIVEGMIRTLYILLVHFLSSQTVEFSSFNFGCQR